MLSCTRMLCPVDKSHLAKGNQAPPLLVAPACVRITGQHLLRDILELVQLLLCCEMGLSALEGP